MSGIHFHPQVKLEANRPPPHLRLAIRPHDRHPFVVRGDHEVAIGRFHDTARTASDAIRAYCRATASAATVRVFWCDGTLWREDEVGAHGRVTWMTYPGRGSGRADTEG